MTEEETLELKDLRIEMQSLKNQKHLLESEILSVETRRGFLKQWKHNRLVGFNVFFVAYVFVFVNILIYVRFYAASSGTNMTNLAEVLTSSISTTALLFLGALHTVLAVCLLVTGVIAIAEHGDSTPARRLAELFRLRNYPSEIKKTEEQEGHLYKEKADILNRIAKITPRLNELEAKETPWWKQ